MPHGPCISDAILRSMAQQRIADGRLPVIFADSVQAGQGSGATCRLCELTIDEQHIEYEVTHPGGPLTFHLACHAIWQLECRASVLRCDGRGDASARSE